MYYIFGELNRDIYHISNNTYLLMYLFSEMTFLIRNLFPRVLDT